MTTYCAYHANPTLNGGYTEGGKWTLPKGHNKQSHYVTTSLGVLKPRPTLRRWRLALPPFSRIALELRKTVGCFWKAFSVCNNNHHAGAKVKVHTYTHTHTPCLEVRGCQACWSTTWKEVVRNTATCPQPQPWLSTAIKWNISVTYTMTTMGQASQWKAKVEPE